MMCGFPLCVINAVPSIFHVRQVSVPSTFFYLLNGVNRQLHGASVLGQEKSKGHFWQYP